MLFAKSSVCKNYSPLLMKNRLVSLTRQIWIWEQGFYLQQSVAAVEPAFAVVVGVVQAVQEEESGAAL